MTKFILRKILLNLIHMREHIIITHRMKKSLHKMKSI